MNTIKYIQCRDTKNNLVTVNTAISSLYIDNDDNLKIETSDELGGNDINIVSKGNISLKSNNGDIKIYSHYNNPLISLSNTGLTLSLNKIMCNNLTVSYDNISSNVENVIKAGLLNANVIDFEDNYGRYSFSQILEEEFDPEEGPLPTILYTLKVNTIQLRFWNNIINRNNYIASYKELNNACQGNNELKNAIKSIKTNESIWIKIIDLSDLFVKYVQIIKKSTASVIIKDDILDKQCYANDLINTISSFNNSVLNSSINYGGYSIKKIYSDSENDTHIDQYNRYNVVNIEYDSNVEYGRAYFKNEDSIEYYKNVYENISSVSIITIENLKEFIEISDELFKTLTLGNINSLIGIELCTSEGDTYGYITLKTKDISPSLCIQNQNNIKLQSKNINIYSCGNTKINSDYINVSSKNLSLSDQNITIPSYVTFNSTLNTIKSTNLLSLLSDNAVLIMSPNVSLNTNTSLSIDAKNVDYMSKNGTTLYKNLDEENKHISYDIIKLNYTNDGDVETSDDMSDPIIEKYFDVPAFYNNTGITEGNGGSVVYAQCSVSDIIKLVAYMKNNHLGPWITE